MWKVTDCTVPPSSSTLGEAVILLTMGSMAEPALASSVRSAARMTAPSFFRELDAVEQLPEHGLILRVGHLLQVVDENTDLRHLGQQSLTFRIGCGVAALRFAADQFFDELPHRAAQQLGVLGVHITAQRFQFRKAPAAAVQNDQLVVLPAGQQFGNGLQHPALAAAGGAGQQHGAAGRKVQADGGKALGAVADGQLIPLLVEAAGLVHAHRFRHHRDRLGRAPCQLRSIHSSDSFRAATRSFSFSPGT